MGSQKDLEKDNNVYKFAAYLIQNINAEHSFVIFSVLPIVVVSKICRGSKEVTHSKKNITQSNIVNLLLQFVKVHCNV